MRVPPVDETQPEVARTFQLTRRLAQRVAPARERNAFPLVLGGNCVSCLGTTAGVGDGEGLGVVWLDAHADFDTPEDNPSGFTVVPEECVVLAGTRALEAYQRDRLMASQVQVVPDAIAATRLTRCANGSSVGHANPYAAPGGPDLEGVLASIDEAFLRFEVAAAAMTAYDPRVDGDGTIAAAAREIAARIASRAAGPS